MTTADVRPESSAAPARVCRVCGESDPARLVQNPRKPGGLAARCRPCTAAAARVRRAANPTGSREYERARRAENPEEGRRRARKRRAAYASRTPEEVQSDRHGSGPVTSSGAPPARCGNPLWPFPSMLKQRTALTMTVAPVIPPPVPVATAAPPRKPGTPSASTARRAFTVEHRPSTPTTFSRGAWAERTRGISCPPAPCNLTRNDTALVWWAERRFRENAPPSFDRVLDVLPNVGSPATRLV